MLKNKENGLVNPYARMLLKRKESVINKSPAVTSLPETSEKEPIKTSEYKEGITDEAKAEVDSVMENIDVPIEDTLDIDYFKTASRKNVMDKYGSIVSDIVKDTGIHPATVFSQLFTESDIRRDGSQGAVSAGIRKGFNPFNIKQYKGSNIEDFYLHMDDEESPSKFIKYKDLRGGLEGYRDFLIRNPRYSEALKAGTPSEQLSLIAQAGFATDPNYESTLMSVLKRDVSKQKFFKGGLIYNYG